MSLTEGQFQPANREVSDPAPPAPGGAPPTDEALMQKAREGDRQAYAELFSRHAERIRRTAYLIVHSTSTADDVVQETFTKGLSHLDTYRGESPPQAWFCAIAVNECRHFLRDGRRGAELAGAEKLDEGRRIARPRTRGVVTHAVHKEDIRLLTLAMGYLTEAQREVFVLHYQDNLPYEEIGQILDMRPGAARALAHRAKETLREKLGSHVPFGRSK
jgi:RNA polymerase sigma-70 factor (ECF subfamily)